MTIRRFHGVQAVLLIAIAALGYAVAGPLRTAAGRRTERLKIALMQRLEESLGAAVSYESISPALLSIITVRGLKVEFNEGSFVASRVRVHYNPLLGLRENSDILSSLTRIVIRDGHLEMELEGGKSPRPVELNLWSLMDGKSLSFTDCSLRVRIGDEVVVEAQELFAGVRDEGNRIRYTFDGRMQVDNPGLAPAMDSVTAAFHSAGSFSSAGSTANGRIKLQSVGSDLVVLAPIAFDFTYGEDEVTIRKINDDRLLNLAVRRSGGVWEIFGEADNLRLEEMISPESPRNAWTPWLPTSIHGQFRVELAGESTAYEASLEFSAPAGDAVRWPLQARLEMQGTEKNANLRMVHLASPWGKVSYTGDFGIDEFAPEGEITFSLEEHLLGYPVEVAFDVRTEGTSIAAVPVYQNNLDFHDFRFLVIRENKHWAFSTLVTLEAPTAEARKQLFLDALLDLEGDPSLRGFLTVKEFPTSRILPLTGLPAMRVLPIVGDSLFSFDAFFEADRLSWFLSVEEALMVSAENPNDAVRVKVRATPEHLFLDALRITWDDFVLDCRGQGRLLPEGGGMADGRLLINQAVYPVSARWSEDGLLEITGNFGLSANMGLQGSGGRFLQVEGESITVPLNDGRLVANIDLQGSFDQQDWSVFINRFRLSFEERQTRPDAVLELNGVLDPRSMVLPSLTLADQHGVLVGNFRYTADSNGRRGRLQLSSNEGEAYHLFFSRESEFWDAGIRVDSARMERFGPERVSGRLDIDGELMGEAPYMSITLQSRDGILDGLPFEIGGSAVMNGDKLRLQDIQFSGKGLSLEGGLVLVDMTKASIRATAQMSAAHNQVPVSTGFSILLDYEDGLSLFDAQTFQRGNFTASLATQPVFWDSVVHFPEFRFHVLRDEQSIRARSVGGQYLDGEYRFSDGRLNVTARSPLPLTMRADGIIHDGRMDVSLPELSIDPILINYVIPRDPILLQYHVVFQRGMFSGNLDIRGPVVNPDLHGTLAVQDLKVDTPYTYASIGAADTDIHFQGKRIVFDRINVPVSDGTVYGGGYMELDHWSLSDFDMTYGCQGTSPGGGVPVFYPLLGVNLDGLVTSEIRMRGNSRGFHLDGDIDFPFLKTSLGTSVEPTVMRRPGKKPKPVSLDFRIRMGNNCTIFLPNEQLRIVRATAEPNHALHLFYSNNPKNLLLNGVLPIKTGEITYLDREFQITEGSMVFNETLADFEPSMKFRAETRVRDEDNQEVTVALVYDAPVMADFNPRIETVPARSEIDILALFGQAVTPYNVEGRTDFNAVLLATGGMLAKASLVQPFEDILREGLNLDMLTIRTDIIENTLLGGLTRSGESGVAAETSGLGRYLDNTSLFAGKYIGNVLFVSGLVTVNYLEGQRLRSVFGGLEFETSLRLEMATPFVNLAWSYSPDPQGGSNFVADNEISLRWQFTF